MSEINFGGSKEQVQNVFLKAGIHDFEVLDFYFQPKGASVKELKMKDGSPVMYTKDNLMIQVKCLKTYTDGKSEGSESHLRVNFDQKNDGKDSSRVDRLFHILSNMSPAAKKEEFQTWLKKASFKSVEDIATKLSKPLTGKQVRYKLTPSEEGKGAYLPGFFGGFAECADVPFERTKLTWDEAKEGNAKKEAGKLEDAGSASNPFETQGNAGAGAAAIDDDLPF